MARLTAPTRPKLVWRISAQAPNGCWVDPSKVEVAALTPALPEVSSGSWVMSSFDLLHGTDIHDDAYADTIPAELFDELFGAPKKAQARPQK